MLKALVMFLITIFTNFTILLAGTCKDKFNCEFRKKLGIRNDTCVKILCMNGEVREIKLSEFKKTIPKKIHDVIQRSIFVKYKHNYTSDNKKWLKHLDIMKDSNYSEIIYEEKPELINIKKFISSLEVDSIKKAIISDLEKKPLKDLQDLNNSLR